MTLDAPAAGPRNLNYTVQTNEADQSDLMLARSKGVAGNYNQTVPLTFRHLLSAVKVAVKSRPTGSTVSSISFSGVAATGTLDMDLDEWTVDATSRSSFSGTGEEVTFLMLPQAITAGQVTLSIVLQEGGTERTLSATLPATAWQIGKAYSYSLNIADYTLEFDNTERTVDAHYLIYKTNLVATSLPAGMQWSLTADQGVTIQAEADANAFAKEGYWTDVVKRNGTVTTESARGTATITGTGPATIPVLIFVPENNSSADRQIHFTFTVGGESTVLDALTLTQKCPYGTMKWEQIDDGESGAYGFNWDRKVAYIFPYNINSNGYTEAKIKEIINALISTYNASSYTSITKYNQGLFTRRLYVLLDYSKLNTLTDVSSTTDGYANTQALWDHVGGSSTTAFEEALNNTYKTESGHETENLFRLPGSSDPSAVPRPSGTNNVESGILNYVLKKNRCYLTEITGDGTISRSVDFHEEDIQWYLPASGQFSAISGDIVDPIVPANYWSSTSSAATTALLGSGTTVSRSSSHAVRTARR